MKRRDFLERITLLTITTAGAGCSTAEKSHGGPERLFFTSGGKTCLVNSDGSGLEVLEFSVPDQVTWQPGPFFSDGRRLILLSMGARRDGPGRPFDQFYTLTPTHLWIYDLKQKSLVEIATKERKEVFYTPQALIDDSRMLVQAPRSPLGQLLSMNLDGSDARPFTRPGEGLPYGFNISPDQRRIAFHLASPQGYQIWTSNAEGGDRKLIAGHPDHLYFGPSWSPDGKWLMFQDCLFKNDPGHDVSDICIARPDGSDLTLLTSGQSHWFAATYGNPQRRGGGSNLPMWTRDGKILFTRFLPGARVPWEYQADRTDTDHFNREWRPERARGGTEICRLNPEDRSFERLTQTDPPHWDLRPCESPSSRRIAFCRSDVGEMPSLWILDSTGGRQRLLTRGVASAGADQPRWLPKG